MRLNYALFGLAALIAAPGYAAAPEFVVTKIIAGPDGGWDYAAVDSAAHRLYVAHGDAVTAVDLESLAVTPKLLAGNHLHTVLPLADGKGLVTNGDDNTAVLFETATGKVLATLPTGKKPDAAIFDPSSGLVLVMDGAAGDITLIDPKTATSPGRIAVGGALEFAAADGRGKAYVNIEDKAEVAVIDIAAREQAARYPLPGCEEPSGLALNAEGSILVSACANGKAVALNTKDGSAAASLPIGSRPDAVIHDAKRGLFFIPCGGTGTLTVISERGGALSVAATVKTAAGARTGALDPKTGLLYLPTADALPATDGERPKGYVPGTFRILVVGEE
jgi:DNA-binding beta-propeller fold protein YncE